MKKIAVLSIIALATSIALSSNVKSMLGAKIGIGADAPKSKPFYGLCFTAEEPNVVVNIITTGSPGVVTLETSRDGVTWIPFDADGGTTPITLANVGDYVYFRAGSTDNSVFTFNISHNRRFSLSGRCAASGDMTSLLSRKFPVMALPRTYIFYRAFSGCATLTSAPELPSVSLPSGSYYQMFSDCKSLTSPPSLPATLLGSSCYYQMFNNCTSLTSAPELLATTLASYCYQEMFRNCTALVSAPEELPATTLKTGCYASMFFNCTKLLRAPELPATTLVSTCYYQMFRACVNLKSVRVSFTGFGSSNETQNWVLYVPSTGTFYCPTALGTNDTIERGASRCPTGWTVVNID